MNLYRFKTFRTSYYFPDVCPGNEILYSLYTPFNSILAKMYWWAFRHFSFVRAFTRVMNIDSEFPFSKIRSLCPEGSTLAFNMGTPGPEQKISLIGITTTGEHFFAKYSTRTAAKQLSMNEMSVLKKLDGKELAPSLLEGQVEDEYCFFRTSCVVGKNPDNIEMCDKIVDLAIQINKHHIGTVETSLYTGLSHGDFTPWNVLIENGKYKMIDWEMADERELGFDVLNYVAYVAVLLNPTASIVSAIEKSQQHLNRYFKTFGITDYSPYLRAFANRKIEYYERRGNQEMADIYRALV